MSLKCGSVNLTKRVTLLSLALLCLLAPTVVLQAQDPPPSCPSCTIDVSPTGPLGNGTVAADPAVPGWSVQYWVDASSSSPYDQADYPRDVRGLALSRTNQYLYAGYNNSENGRGEVRKIDTTETNPLTQPAIEAVLFGFRGKAIAVDDKDRVYLAEGFHATDDSIPATYDLTQQVVIYDSTLTTLLFSFGSEAGCTPSPSHYCLPAGSRPEGVAVVRQGTSLVLYVSDRALDTLTQFTLTENGSGISSATFNGEVIVSGASDLRGVEVDKSGRIWVADPSADGVFVVESTLTSSTFVSVPDAMDIGFDDVNAFVTQGPNASGSTITVLSQSTFATVTTLTPPYALLNINPTVNGVGEDPRLSGIAVACPLFDCTTPGFYVANEAAWTAVANADDSSSFDREPIIRANAGTFTPCPQGCGKVTGGGQIAIGTSGAKKSYANYGFNVQVKDGVVKGQLEYLDHTTGANYHSVKMTSLTVSTDFKTATFTGEIIEKGSTTTCTSADKCTFTVKVEDNGEPGRNDIFEITIEDGYAAGQGQTVAKGNIQIHRKCG